jgi:hypothetical protein
VSLSPGKPMRRCGKPYGSEAHALASKLGRVGAHDAVPCRCGSWHLRPKPARPATRTSPMGSLHPFPAAAIVLIDLRDAITAEVTIPVRLCQRDGSAQNLARHHRRGKGQGGSENRPHTQCPCNAVTLCQRCHYWAHVLEPRQAMAEGFIVSRSVGRPGSVGVMRFAAAQGGATMWPSCGGLWLETAPEAREMAASHA